MTNQAISGKTRTRQHVIADLAVNYVERQVLLCGYTGQRVQHDYGYDFTAVTYDQRGQVEGGVVFFQVKATDRLLSLKDGRTVSWPISRRDLKLWLSEAYPVIFVLYDGSRDRAYWLHIQSHFAGYPTAKLFATGDELNVHIPLVQRVNRRAIRAIARCKNEVQEQIHRKAGHDV